MIRFGLRPSIVMSTTCTFSAPAPSARVTQAVLRGGAAMRVGVPAARESLRNGTVAARYSRSVP